MSACMDWSRPGSLATESHSQALAALAGVGGETDDLKRIADYIYSREQ